MTASIFLRAATAADQSRIRQIVRAAGINPMSLAWPRFIVAEDRGQIVGVGQVKPHGDGSRELASIAVVPERQTEGIGSVIVETLIRLENGPLYLTCASHNEGYYLRFGFRTLQRAEMPRDLRRLHRLGRVIISVVNLFTRRRERMLVMGRNV